MSLVSSELMGPKQKLSAVLNAVKFTRSHPLVHQEHALWSCLGFRDNLIWRI